MRWLISVPRDRMGHSNSERQMVAGPVLGREATVPLGTPFSSRIAGLFYVVDGSKRAQMDGARLPQGPRPRTGRIECYLGYFILFRGGSDWPWGSERK